MVPIMLLTMVGITPVAKAESSLGIRVGGAILVDADSGKVLYEENADQPLGIASMTKMMTEYLMFEAIEEGTITWDQQYRVNGYTYAISQDRRLSNVPLRRDGTYTIRELYEAVAIYSANAATIAIAETIAGTEAEFVNLMNDKAKELGLTDYKFVNSTGLNNEDLQGMHPSEFGGRDENVMPARSVAKMAYHLLKDYPEVLDTTKISKKVFREGTSDAIDMKNWNFMLPGLDYEYRGVDGLKTGTTVFAGHCFTGTAIRDDKRIIAVVLNAVDDKGVGSYEARFDATRSLFDYGFSQFSNVELLPKGYQFKEQKTLGVLKGKERKVGIETKEPISLLIRNMDKKKYEPQLILDEKLVKNGQVQAPIEKGTVIGHVKLVKKDGTDLGFIDGKVAGTEVITTEEVEKAGWFALTLGAIGDFFSSAWSSSTGFVKGIFN
ncbi:serine hydrolase [Sporosarcina sp. GW1-11]|nr:serine hydrolase [Sporosarcina sp. GW1-11]MDV6379424.1 serine hydrolase [Sporosarcina sp. GW1-11]